ncbi:MAG: PAS domain-containing protein [Bacteroidales bacterium]|nr:PAS domain-containing protein [Clostridium sp.]MCM1203812.1 PAS domain-containing protein [Bacteroidales bacterium]
MNTKRIESFKEFAKHLEYPMVVFEADSGKVLNINHEAEEVLGGAVQFIHIEPARALTKLNFWEILHGKKSIMWHRIRVTADGREHLVCGLVNEMMEEEKLIYTLLFEPRADLNIGSFTLERIVNHAHIVAIHMGRNEEGYQVEYISRNINHYGYTRDQLYDNLLEIGDIICPEDLERVQESIADAADKRIQENEIECRIVTEERDLIPVRLLIHYIYNTAGNLTDFEILLFDLREEFRRNSENAYLNNAISKMKSVVLVKSYHAGKRALNYISPNAGMVGMNVDALKNGYKLTEDYIHPEDRDSVIDAIYQAVATGVTDYVHTYRMVRDDGKQIWVENEVSVTRISDGEAEVSFLLTDITEQKDMEKELAAVAGEEKQPPQPNKPKNLSLITIDEEDKEMLKHFQLMAETLSQNADYYSVVLSAEGRQLTSPAGPANNIGQFYDLFERPQLKEQFSQLSERAKEQLIPQSVSFTMGKMEVHMVLAPLMLENTVTAYWVLTSFAKNGAEILGEVAGQQWHLANSIAKSFYAEEVVLNERRLRKLSEIQLHKEQQERHVIQDLMDSMIREGEAGLGEMCQKAGIYLSVTDIGLYLENKETGNAEKYFVWNHAGAETPGVDTLAMSVSEYKVLKEYLGREQALLAGKKSQEPFLKELIRKSEMESVMILGMNSVSGTRGYVVFADRAKPHIFEKKDVNFAACVTHMFESVVLSNQKAVKPDITKEGFLEAYDHIRDAVFVKDDKSGEIIFANKAMDKLFGYSLVGMQAKDVVNDQLEQYRNMQGVRKRFIANKKVSKWQSYMKELDQIMNIVEIQMEMLSGAQCSLFILKKNKNK